MNNEEINSKVQEIFRDVFQAPALVINPEMTANDVDKWDSLTHLTMIAKVEEAFGFRFKLKEMVKMKNVGDMLTIINEKLIA
ncbi:MAG: acyl carrier protein [Bacteroidetes bacterium GWF2_43_63]|nr:MAG: acyl carrier protein [Bacteroidetes bacterium GWE2_42_42]OFY52967.1 MAG: acyl carrier protein [Bacteroidetes bacterium GWF2_43_63]HBG70177.1 acyl carrier protein [Bacteroidales bacterium]HCB62216.1 acyl carrier protein [Bacteroidales bacterium]